VRAAKLKVSPDADAVVPDAEAAGVCVCESLSD